LNGGVAGFIGTRSTNPKMMPLYHLRKGTHNAGSDNTHDHYYALGDAERDAVKASDGYEVAELVGWVFPTVESLP